MVSYSTPNIIISSEKFQSFCKLGEAYDSDVLMHAAYSIIKKDNFQFILVLG